MGEKSEEFWNGYHAGLAAAQGTISSIMAKQGITEKEKEVLLEVVSEIQEAKQKTEIVLESSIQNILEQLMPD